MFDISKFSDSYSVRFLKDSDADDILDFCLQNTQYYQYCGKQPSKELILNDLHMIPPNTTADSKYYVGFYDNDILAAIIDLVDGYPDRESAFIGFFMVNKKLQGNQIGTRIIKEICLYVKTTGINAILLGFDKGNPQSSHFWKKNGFNVIKEIDQDEGTVSVAERSL